MRAAVALLALLAAPSAGTGQAVDSARVQAFRTGIEAFALDLAGARDVEVGRARRLAYQAGTEAWRYDVPLALVFGVMLQETIDLDRHAVSVAGAQGLMQIMPNIWKPVLGRYFGDDLTDEGTNIRYGVWILAHYLHLENGDWEAAVARYSGRARLYAARVKAHVEQRGPNVCPERSMHLCVAVPARRTFGR